MKHNDFKNEEMSTNFFKRLLDIAQEINNENTRKEEVEPLVYTVKQAAKALNISQTTCYELIREGKLPHLKLGGRKLIPIKALEEFIERGVELWD
ncbi:helix-turn-helix domain-containing protein [Thermoactinomyces vulgaris]|jgi:excisionase family DNA binding protein|uniref:helix-turn-helix domain-containing protein n=1 Tax=Thermoactinomyces vulgaris TaxID=2026 RepID=UPI0036332FF2